MFGAIAVSVTHRVHRQIIAVNAMINFAVRVILHTESLAEITVDIGVAGPIADMHAVHIGAAKCNRVATIPCNHRSVIWPRAIMRIQCHVAHLDIARVIADRANDQDFYGSTMTIWPLRGLVGALDGILGDVCHWMNAVYGRINYFARDDEKT